MERGSGYRVREASGSERQPPNYLPWVLKKPETSNIGMVAETRHLWYWYLDPLGKNQYNWHRVLGRVRPVEYNQIPILYGSLQKSKALI